MSKYKPGLDDDRLVGQALSALAEDTARAEAPASLEARLREAFRAPAPAAPVAPQSGAWKWIAGLGMAAGVMWLLYAGARPAPVEPREARTPEAAIPPAIAPSVVERSAEPPVRVARSEPRTVRVADPGPRRARRPPVIERFEPLYPGDPLADLDAVHVVRLSVPRSALATLGWPGRPGGRDDSVELDAMVGPDGMTRAVRFISQ